VKKDADKSVAKTTKKLANAQKGSSKVKVRVKSMSKLANELISKKEAADKDLAAKYTLLTEQIAKHERTSKIQDEMVAHVDHLKSTMRDLNDKAQQNKKAITQLGRGKLLYTKKLRKINSDLEQMVAKVAREKDIAQAETEAADKMRDALEGAQSEKVHAEEEAEAGLSRLRQGKAKVQKLKNGVAEIDQKMDHLRADVARAWSQVSLKENQFTRRASEAGDMFHEYMQTEVKRIHEDAVLEATKIIDDARARANQIRGQANVEVAQDAMSPEEIQVQKQMLSAEESTRLQMAKVKASRDEADAKATMATKKAEVEAASEEAKESVKLSVDAAKLASIPQAAAMEAEAEEAVAMVKAKAATAAREEMQEAQTAEALAKRDASLALQEQHTETQEAKSEAAVADHLVHQAMIDAKTQVLESEGAESAKRTGTVEGAKRAARQMEKDAEMQKEEIDAMAQRVHQAAVAQKVETQSEMEEASGGVRPQVARIEATATHKKALVESFMEKALEKAEAKAKLNQVKQRDQAEVASTIQAEDSNVQRVKLVE
jgi:hypothetical protein